MSVRVASGRVGSSGMARVSFKKGLTHQRRENSWSTAKTGSLFSIEKAHMIECDDRVGTRLVEVFETPDLEPVESPQQDRQKILEGAGRHGLADPDGGEKTDGGDAEEQHRDPDPRLLQECH